MDWLVGWKYQKQIVISEAFVDENLANFPLYVPIANAASIANESTNSIRFTAADGVTIIPHEWTGFGDGGGSGAMVKVPSINATADTTIYLYYGNTSASGVSAPSTVWSDYAIAAHLDAWINNQQESANGYPLVAGGSPSAAIGMIGGGINMPTSVNSQLALDANLSAIQSQLTNTGMAFSTILKNWTWTSGQENTNRTVFTLRNTEVTGINGFMFRLRPDTKNADFAVRSSNVARTASAASGKVQGDTCYLGGTATIANGQLTSKVFVDGVMLASNSTATGASTLDFSSATQDYVRIGMNSTFGIRGILDEVRVRKVATSNAWMKFEHANLMSVGNQLAFGTQKEYRPNLVRSYYYQRTLQS